MTQTAAAPADARRWLLLGGVWAIYFAFGLTSAALGPLVGPIGAAFGVGHGTMGAIMGAWPFVYIAAALPCGLLLDRIGAARGLVLAGLLIAASGLARGLAPGPGTMLAAVGLFGLGGPLISVGAPKLIAGLFEGPARGTAMGVYMTGPYLGGIAAVALTGSVLLPAFGGDWRAVLVAYAGVAGLAALVWAGLAHPRAAGGALRAEGPGKGFSLAAFAALLRLPEVRLVLAMSVGIFFFSHAFNNWLPALLTARGLPAAAAGLWAAIPAAVGVAGALVIPRLATPPRRMSILAGLFAAGLLASLLLHLTPGPGLVAGLVLQGLARSAAMTLAVLILMELPRVPKDRLGMAGGLFFAAAEVGGVLGPVSFGVLSEATGGFAAPLLVVTALMLGLLGLLQALARTPWRP